jgi:hypothetical protein
MATLTQNQLLLVQRVRQNFYDTIKKALENNDKTIVLVFDEKLWEENCKTLTGELLTRFGEFTVSSNNSKYVVTKVINNASEIPDNIKKIQIDLLN